MKKWSVVRRIERGWDGFARIRRKRIHHEDEKSTKGMNEGMKKRWLSRIIKKACYLEGRPESGYIWEAYKEKVC